MKRRAFLAGSAATAAASAASASTLANRERVLRVAFEVAETGFDPVQLIDSYSRRVTAHIFDALLQYDYYARQARLRPNAAAAMPEVSADYRTFTFRLKPGILFQDDPAFNGKPRELTAADYVYSFKRFFDPRWKSPMLFNLQNAKIVGADALRARALKGARFDYDTPIEGLRALDRYTVQIRLEQPHPRFIYLMADSGNFGAVAREVVEKYGDDTPAHPIGTGPFRLGPWRRSSRIVLERNPTYRKVVFDFEAPDGEAELAATLAPLRGRTLPLVDQVDIAVVEESQPRWLSFVIGDFDTLLVPVDMVNLAAPQRKISNYLVRRGIEGKFSVTAGVTLSYFNMEHPIVGGLAPEKVALRRAIALGFDGELYIRTVFGGSAIRAQTSIAPDTFGYDPALRTELSQFDPVRAKALLDTFGYLDRDGDGFREMPNGSELTLEMSSTSTQRDRLQNEIWERSMKNIGLRIRFRIAPWPELNKMSMAGKLMMWGYAWQLTEPDSDLLLGVGYSPNRETLNDARFSLPAYDALYERQRVLPDGPERLTAMRDGTRLLTAYMPYLFHLHRVYLDLWQPWLRGYRRNPFTERWWHLVDVARDDAPVQG
jgi:ABC-type transport system substrate-binding protein